MRIYSVQKTFFQSFDFQNLFQAIPASFAYVSVTNTTSKKEAQIGMKQVVLSRAQEKQFISELDLNSDQLYEEYLGTDSTTIDGALSRSQKKLFLDKNFLSSFKVDLEKTHNFRFDFGVPHDTKSRVHISVDGIQDQKGK